MNKYIKLICRCCGWFNYEWNPEHPNNFFIKDKDIDYQKKRICVKCNFNKCQKCKNIIQDFNDILIVDPITFDDGLG